VRNEQEAGTKWKRNGTHLPQAHEKHNTDFFIFLQLLSGGGEFLWLLHEVLYKSKLL
jgi:hypothetical protein